MVQFVKASTFVISAHLKISTLIVVSRFLSAMVSPEWRLNLTWDQTLFSFRFVNNIPAVTILG